MKIIEPSFEIIDPLNQAEGVRLLQKIERMARISHRSENKQTPESYDKFLRAVVVGHADWSVVEHASATVIFRVDRGVTHELVRHRLFSFTQESTRFVKYGVPASADATLIQYGQGMEFICPDEVYKPDRSRFATFEYAMSEAEKNYMGMLADGVRPQEARSVLPNALAATIAVTGNLRNWRYLFLMRTSKETHQDFRKVTIPLLEKFQQLVPILFEDILPGQRQIDNLRMPR
jgi:thymidylate synthase (FAD)